MVPFSLINQLTLEVNSSPMPLVAGTSFKVLNIGVRLVWWFVKKRKEDSFLLLLGGGSNLLIKSQWIPCGDTIASWAKYLHIITQIQKCSAQTILLGSAYTDLYHFARGRNPSIIKPVWEKSSNPAFFSPSFHNGWNQKAKKMKSFAKELYDHVLKIFKEIRILALHIWDTYNATFMDNNNDEAMEEWLINLKNWLDLSKNNRIQYIKMAWDSKSYMDAMITYAGLKMDSTTLIEAFVKTINTTAAIAEGVDVVSEAAGDNVISLIQRSATIFLETMGLRSFVPKSILNFEDKSETSQAPSPNETPYSFEPIVVSRRKTIHIPITNEIIPKKKIPTKTESKTAKPISPPLPATKKNDFYPVPVFSSSLGIGG